MKSLDFKYGLTGVSSLLELYSCDCYRDYGSDAIRSIGTDSMSLSIRSAVENIGLSWVVEEVGFMSG